MADITFALDGKQLQKLVDEKVANGDVHLECHGMRDVAEGLQWGFTIDKSRYFVRLEETEETLKIVFEPKFPTAVTFDVADA